MYPRIRANNKYRATDFVRKKDPKEVGSKDIICQCMEGADVLLDNFRNDVSCHVLSEFENKGVSLEKLLELQKKVPIYYPWNFGYNNLRTNVNRRFVAFPMGIAMCETTEQVVKMIKFCRKYDIHFVTRSGAHCFERYSLTDGIIIDQSRRNGFKVEETGVILEPGVLQGPLQLELAKHDLAFVGGTCPNVGLGIILGGGIGFLTRTFGLSSDNLLEIEIVLASGDVIRASKDQHSDLFWACQGAGVGNFGIITQYIVSVKSISTVSIYNLIYPIDELNTVLQTWQRWAPFTDNRMSSELDVYADYVQVTGQFLGCKEEMKKFLAPFENIPSTSLYFKTVPFIDAVRFFAGMGRWMPFFKNKSAFVFEFWPEEATEIIKKHMKNAGPEDHLELDALGGFNSEVPSDATAFPYREGTLFWAHFQAHFSHQQETFNRVKWVTEFYDEMKPFIRGAYVNAPDADLKDPLKKYFAENLSELIKIKDKYDPDNVFHYGQSIPTSEEAIRRVTFQDDITII